MPSPPRSTRAREIESTAAAGLDARSRDVAACLDRQLGSGCAVEVAPVSGPIGRLFASEMPGTERMVEERLREFACGRDLARRCLVTHGLDPKPIPRGPDGAPGWPDGVVGSIAHGGGLCAVAAARCPTPVALGIDLEPVTPLDPDLIGAIATPADLAAIHASAFARAPVPVDDGVRALAVFAVKEAVYKAQYALTETFLEFADVRLAVTAAGALCAEVLPRTAAAPLRDLTLHARHDLVGGLHVASCFVAPDVDAGPDSR